MSAEEQARADSAEMAATIFNGAFLLQTVAWRSFVAKHEATLAAELRGLAGALRRFVELRERGLAEGGPPQLTNEDVDKADQLAALVSMWLAGGALSPEVEPIARHLFALLGGDGAALPPEDEASQGFQSG